MNIELGDTVKDEVTGFKGIVVAITHWLNGCARITVQSENLTKEGTIALPETIDANQIVIVSKRVHTTKRDDTGGPRSGPTQLAAPVRR